MDKREILGQASEIRQTGRACLVSPERGIEDARSLAPALQRRYGNHGQVTFAAEIVILGGAGAVAYPGRAAGASERGYLDRWQSFAEGWHARCDAGEGSAG